MCKKEKVIRTKVTEMLGIEYPIIQGCMQWISRAPLVAAVSEAGGLGLLSSSTFSNADDLPARKAADQQALCGQPHPYALARSSRL